MQPVQPTQPAQPAKKVSAFRIGLLFGIILAVIMIAFNFAEQFAKDVIGAGGLILTILTIIISLAAFFFAGFRASSQSGKVSTGLLAGMWTGIISSLVNGVASVLLTIPQLPELTRTANQAIIDTGAQTNIPLYRDNDAGGHYRRHIPAAAAGQRDCAGCRRDWRRGGQESRADVAAGLSGIVLSVADGRLSTTSARLSTTAAGWLSWLSTATATTTGLPTAAGAYPPPQSPPPQQGGEYHPKSQDSIRQRQAATRPINSVGRQNDHHHRAPLDHR